MKDIEAVIAALCQDAEDFVERLPRDKAWKVTLEWDSQQLTLRHVARIDQDGEAGTVTLPPTGICRWPDGTEVGQ